jgi:hypothetical protein
VFQDKWPMWWASSLVHPSFNENNYLLWPTEEHS